MVLSFPGVLLYVREDSEDTHGTSIFVCVTGRFQHLKFLHEWLMILVRRRPLSSLQQLITSEERDAACKAAWDICNKDF